MKSYSSSTLKIFNNHCPAALGFTEAGTLWNSEWNTAPGIAAHAICQMAGEYARKHKRAPGLVEINEIAKEACTSLITKGRVFRGQHEPPMSCEDAFAGRDIALPWLRDNPMDPDAFYERELFLKTGEYSAIFDAFRVYDDEDEDQFFSVAESTDYKSAWPTGAGELDTLQCRGHAVLLRENFPEADVIRTRVVNLRTRAVYTRDLYVADEADAELLSQWRTDCVSAVIAANETREPRPGAGCVGCPFAYVCPDVWAPAAQAMDGMEDGATLQPSDVATSYVIGNEIRQHYAPLARSLAKEQPIEVADGSIGYWAKERRHIKPDAAKHILYVALDISEPNRPAFDAENAQLIGMLNALKLSSSNIEKVLTWLFPLQGIPKEDRPAVRDMRDDFLDATTEMSTVAEFGVIKGQDK